MAKVMVSLDDQLLRGIDRAAKASGRSRSAYLSDLAAEDLARAESPDTTSSARAALRSLDRLFADSPAEDSTEAIRAGRDAG